MTQNHLFFTPNGPEKDKDSGKTLVEKKSEFSNVSRVLVSLSDNFLRSGHTTRSNLVEEQEDPLDRLPATDDTSDDSTQQV